MSNSAESFNESSLPLNYSKWVYEIIRADIPAESLATCNDCAMCRKANDTTDLTGQYFDPKVRCCSYVPELPNFLIGRILMEKDLKNVPGRDKLIKRLDEKLHATPLGLGSGKLYSLIYDNSNRAFGTSFHLRCPYYIEEGDLCGIWKHRNSVCSTWFCKHERGNEGARFWEAVKRLLNTIEYNLAYVCLKELKMDNSAIFELLALKEAKGPDNPARYLVTSELDNKTDEMKYRQLWGNYADREIEFYIKCAEYANKLKWKDVMDLCGPEVSLMVPLVKEAFLRLKTTELPDFLESAQVKISQITDEEVLIETYSEYNPISLPPSIFEILSGFDGRSTKDVLRSLLKEKKLDVDEEFIRVLVDYHILIPKSQD